MYRLLIGLLAGGLLWAQTSITTIAGSDLVSTSFTTINSNFSSLNANKPEVVTVAHLGAASARSGQVALVIDGASITDCTVGNGTTLVMCKSSGTAWAAFWPTFNQNTTGTAAGLSSTLAAGSGGTGVANTATLTLGSANVNWATLGTGIIKNTTTTGAHSLAAYSDVVGLWTTCTGYLKSDGTCASLTTMMYPSSGIAKSTGTAWTAPAYTDITALWTTCTGYLKSDGTCVALTTMAYPSNSGFAIVNSGTSWGTTLADPLTVGHGGTGLATLTAHALYAGNATSAPTAIGPDSSTTKALFSAGASADPAFRVIATGDLPSVTRTIGCAVGDPAGSALATGVLCYIVAPIACTIQSWDILVDSGTATAGIWKIATGTALPTVSNSIVASAAPAISTGTAIHSTTMTSWTTSVAKYDIFGFNLTTTSGPKYIYVGVNCDGVN